jgi:F-type H+-transporting ATPase subunit epsilon
MAEQTFHLHVITPDKTAMEGSVTSLQVRAVDGRMGVWTNHAPLIAMLDVGRLMYRDANGDESWLATGEGFIEVLNNNVKVLCDFAETPEEIDAERAREAEERAHERLKHRAKPDIDETRAEAALRRAIVRLKLAKNPGR